jgi:hypothetical protein
VSAKKAVFFLTARIGFSDRNTPLRAESVKWRSPHFCRKFKSDRWRKNATKPWIVEGKWPPRDELCFGHGRSQSVLCLRYGRGSPAITSLEHFPQAPAEKIPESDLLFGREWPEGQCISHLSRQMAPDDQHKDLLYCCEQTRRSERCIEDTLIR